MAQASKPDEHNLLTATHEVVSGYPAKNKELLFVFLVLNKIKKL